LIAFHLKFLYTLNVNIYILSKEETTMQVTKKGSVTSFQFEDKKELDCWANKNITNPKVRDAVLAPVSIRGKLKKNIKYKNTKRTKEVR
jgi:hypothetical protein